MAQRFALPALAALALAALVASLPLRAAENPPKPGTIVTVAGTGQPGFSRDGCPATLAQLGSPNGVALDAAGNLSIAEWDRSPAPFRAIN